MVQDDIDSQRTGFLIGTPALDRELVPCCVATSYLGLRLADGSRYDAAVGQEYQRTWKNTSPFYPGGAAQLLQVMQIYVTSAIEAEAQRAIHPEADRARGVRAHRRARRADHRRPVHLPAGPGRW